MSLKQCIQEEYQKWVTKTRPLAARLEPSSTNYPDVSKNIAKLKDDLCKFAENFDKNFIGLNVKLLKKIPEAKIKR